MISEIEQALMDLKAQDIKVQIEAAHILGDAGYKAALQELLTLIRKTPSELVKSAALSAIGNIDPQGFYGHLLALIIELTGAERGFITLKDPVTGKFDAKSAALNMPDAPPDAAIHNAVIKETVSTGKSLLTDNTAMDERFEDQQSIAKIKLRSIATTPITVNNEIIGVVYVDNRIMNGLFNVDQSQAVNHLLVAAGDALEELHSLSTDAETGETKKEAAPPTTSPQEFDEVLEEAILKGETDEEALPHELEELQPEPEEKPEAPTTIPGGIDDGLFGTIGGVSPEPKEDRADDVDEFGDWLMDDEANEPISSPAPQVQPPQPAAEVKSDLPPNFDSMSPAELKIWMEDLVKQQENEPPSPTRQQHQNAAPPPSSAISDVRFSAYYPKEVAPGKWYPLNAYVFKAGYEDATRQDAQKELGPVLAGMRRVAQAARQILREGVTITATPVLPGFQCNPPSISVGFFEDWHRFAFKVRATDSAPKFQATNGFLTFTVEGIIVADIPLAVFVGEDTQMDTQTVSAVQDRLYKAIFCSYSRRDTKIIERVERAYKALGYDYLRDINTIKSGQDWDERLYQMIEDADIFQLFWSGTAAQSPYVEREWRHALTLGKDTVGFIRPVWWEQPMPAVPQELGHIHFAYQPDLTKD